MLWRIFRLALEAIGGLLVLFVCAALAYNYLVHYQSKLEAWPSKSTFAAPVVWSPDNSKLVRILTIDGGGMQGIASLEILKHLEQKSGRPLSEMFDFVAGTSTGAIVASLLLLPDENGKPKYTVEDAAQIYSDLSQQIFIVPFFHRVFTLDGLLGPRFLNHGKFIESSEVFRGYRFGELIRPAMIPAYSRSTSDLHVFLNLNEPDANLRLGPLIAAATSAPSIFPGVELLGHSKLEGMYDDAGLILNNPAHRAFEYVLTRNPNSEIVVVSVGTSQTQIVTRDIDLYGGLVDWLVPLHAMVSKGQAGLSTRSLETLERVGTVVNLKSFRFAAPIPLDSGVFDASKSNIERLKKAGRVYVSENQTELAEALQSLVGPDRHMTRQSR